MPQVHSEDVHPEHSKIRDPYWPMSELAKFSIFPCEVLSLVNAISVSEGEAHWGNNDVGFIGVITMSGSSRVTSLSKVFPVVASHLAGYTTDNN